MKNEIGISSNLGNSEIIRGVFGGGSIDTTTRDSIAVLEALLNIKQSSAPLNSTSSTNASSGVDPIASVRLNHSENSHFLKKDDSCSDSVAVKTDQTQQLTPSRNDNSSMFNPSCEDSENSIKMMTQDKTSSLDRSNAISFHSSDSSLSRSNALLSSFLSTGTFATNKLPKRILEQENEEESFVKTQKISESAADTYAAFIHTRPCKTKNVSTNRPERAYSTDSHILHPADPVITNSNFTRERSHSELSAQFLNSKKMHQTTSMPTVNMSTSVKEQAESAPVSDMKSQITIRSDKIKAALQSKPQRGRKRDNLNVLERRELTRTRNREHAKSTRIRKKARYEELVHNEKMYFDLKQERDLEEYRRLTVIKFMEIRTQFIRGIVSDLNDSSWHFSLDVNSSNKTAFPSSSDVNGPGLKKNGAIPSFTTFQTSKQSQLLTPDSVHSNLLKQNHTVRSNSKNALNDVIDNIKLFKFISSPGQHHASLGIWKLQAHDSDIANRVRSALGDDVISSLEFRISGGPDSVALTKDSKGFADFDLVLKGKDGRSDFILCAGILNMEFASCSNKLVSIQNSVNVNYFDDSDKVSNARSELGKQPAFPSVVSLDFGSSNNLPSKASSDCVHQNVGISGNAIISGKTVNISEKAAVPSHKNELLQKSPSWSTFPKLNNTDQAHNSVPNGGSVQGNEHFHSSSNNNLGPGMNI
mmetsp:Transcript_1830/g.2631  ORF Transcript_1830/g.2631 Transcript_1830/m.2631 type:complete len:701 (-) Transcript_1830:348-2450(-)|eukprot:CAMPEP_0184865100 /NCGR_PEP_ID=MMETSP0580-20130426/16975_1 /TAXON_ID=1118495 /ORGANISM="Dactyliosolen fragilissimus" /LENGTH=700 /DNA_ID=CAMNT_0027364147 /DNA_START=187 /DNA_END=2289 /DNA_ORIENTATION=+